MKASTFSIDTSTDYGKRVDGRLRQEKLIWLTTVGADHAPEPIPVWFLWDGSSFLVYSEPGKRKLKNIELNRSVALHFDGDGKGGNIVTFKGEARVSNDPPSDQVPDYVAKYEPMIRRMGMDPKKFAKTYSVPVRIRPTQLRGH